MTYHIHPKSGFWAAQDDLGEPVSRCSSLGRLICGLSERAHLEKVSLVVHDLLPGQDVTYSFPEGDRRAHLSGTRT